MFLVLFVTFKVVNLPTSSSGSKVMVSMSTGDSSLPFKAAGEDRTCSYNVYTKGRVQVQKYIYIAKKLVHQKGCHFNLCITV